MTIAEGQTVDQADLDSLVSTELAQVQADAARLPLGYHQVFAFRDVVGGGSPTAEHRRTKTWVVPRDCYIETVAIQTGDVVGDVTVTITGDGALNNWPLSFTETVATGVQRFSRSLYDNTKSRARDRGFRVLPKGSTLTVTVSTTSTVTPSLITVTLVLRQFFGR